MSRVEAEAASQALPAALLGTKGAKLMRLALHWRSGN